MAILSASAQLIGEIWDVFICLKGANDMQLEFNLDGSGSVTTIIRSNRVILCHWDNLEDAIEAIDAME